MSRRHADNWSHPCHYLVDPYTWPWSPNGHGHEWPTATPFVQCQSALPFWDTVISKFNHENPWSRLCVWSKVKVTFDLQISKVKVMVRVKPISHIWGLKVQSICLLFVSWQSDHFWLRYRKFHIWPRKFKVKVMAKVKPKGHIWCLEFNRYVCFSFRGNRTTFGWDIGNSIFYLENSRSRSWPRSNLMVTFEALSSIDMFVFVSWQSDHFWLRYSKFYIWPWKFKVKVMAKVESDGHIWALDFNRYVCFRFVAIGPFLAEI